MPNDTERAPRRRPIANNAHTDWLKKLAEIPALPTTEEGEWYHTVESSWMHGISVNDRPQDSNTYLTLTRAANNESRFGKPSLSYDVFFQWGTGRDYGNITLDAEAAIYFGQHLIEAGAAALQDQARHATWMLGVAEVTVETPETVLTPAESLPLTQVGSGRHEKLATVRAGQAAVTAERFDYRPDDGTPPSVEWALRAQTTGMDGDYEVDLTSEDVEGMRRQVANVVGALTRVMEVFDDEAEKLTRAEV